MMLVNGKQHTSQRKHCTEPQQQQHLISICIFFSNDIGGSADPQSRRNTNRGGSGADINYMYNLHLFIYIFCTIS